MRPSTHVHAGPRAAGALGDLHCPFARRRACGIALLAAALLAPRPAHGFEWPGRLRLLEQQLRSARPNVRRAAVNALADRPIEQSRGLLLRATRDPDDSVRLAAAEALVRHREAAVLPVLVEWLADFTVSVRARAAKLLGQLGNPAAVPPLIRAFGDFEHTVRMAAVQALGQLGSRRAVTGILGRLYDPNRKVRRAAIRALADLADPRSVIPLLGKLADASREIRAAAVRALARIGDRRAVMPIVRLLGDPAASVRIAAIDALGQLRPTAAAPALIQALQRATATRERAALYRALARLRTPESLRALVAALTRSGAAHGVRESLVEAGRPVVPLLLEALAQPGTATRQASEIVSILADIGDRRASRVLLQELRRDRVDRALVLRALASCGDASAVVPLLSLLARATLKEKRAIVQALEPIVDARFSTALLPLLDDPSLPIRKATVRMLGRLRARVAVRPLVALLAHADPDLVRSAVRSLGQIGDPAAGAALVPLLTQGPAETRRAVVNALARVGTPSLAKPLLTLARDPDAPPQDRSLALDALAGVFRDRSLGSSGAALLQMLSPAHPPFVRAGALTVMAASGDRTLAAPLAARQGSLPPGLQPLAVRALARLRHPVAQQRIREAARSRLWPVRAEAVWAMSRDPAAAARLASRLRDPHPAVRLNAAGALAARPTPSARPALLRLLRERTVSPYLLANVVLALGRIGNPSDALALRRLLQAGSSSTNPYLVRNLVRALRRLGVPAARIRDALPDPEDPAIRALLAAPGADRRKPGASTGPRRSAGSRDGWIAITLVDSRGFPVPGGSLYVVLPDGRVRWCVTDVRGELFLEGLPPGSRIDYEPVRNAAR